MDLPSHAALHWEIRFVLDRFSTARISVVKKPGQSLTIPIKLYQVR